MGTSHCGLTSFISITIIFGNTRLPSRRSYWLYRRGNGVLGSPAPPSIDTRRSSATYTFPTSAGCPATSGVVAKARAFYHHTFEDVAKSFIIQERTSATIPLLLVLGDLYHLTRLPVAGNANEYAGSNLELVGKQYIDFVDGM